MISLIRTVAACSLLFFVSCEAEPIDEVRVLPNILHQTIEGFGCSVNGWTAPMIPLFYKEGFADYAANELGMSVFRVQMWGGVSPNGIEDWRDISYLKFGWKGPGLRGKVNVDWAKVMVEANPEVKIIGSVWSPPGWMKENGMQPGTASGYLFDPNRTYDSDNRLRKDRYQHFAKWVVEWCRYMESQGTPFYAISLQNELVFTQWFESAMYTPDEYAEVVRITGEMFESEGVAKPLFFGPEDMTSATYANAVRHKPFVDALMEPAVAKYFDVFATHGYTDGVKSDSERSTAAYWRSIKDFGLPYWVTEGGSGKHEWPAPVLTGIAPRMHVSLVESNVSLFCGWQLAGERGHGSEHDFMSWDQPTKKTYATMHFWKHIRPGAVRVETFTEAGDLLVSSYRHDRSQTLVTILINQSPNSRNARIEVPSEIHQENWEAFQTSEELNHEAVEISLICKGKVELALPGYSITTVVSNMVEYFE